MTEQGIGTILKDCGKDLQDISVLLSEMAINLLNLANVNYVKETKLLEKEGERNEISVAG